MDKALPRPGDFSQDASPQADASSIFYLDAPPEMLGELTTVLFDSFSSLEETLQKSTEIQVSTLKDLKDSIKASRKEEQAQAFLGSNKVTSSQASHESSSSSTSLPEKVNNSVLSFIENPLSVVDSVVYGILGKLFSRSKKRPGSKNPTPTPSGIAQEEDTSLDLGEDDEGVTGLILNDSYVEGSVGDSLPDSLDSGYGEGVPFTGAGPLALPDSTRESEAEIYFEQASELNDLWFQLLTEPEASPFGTFLTELLEDAFTNMGGGGEDSPMIVGLTPMLELAVLLIAASVLALVILLHKIWDAIEDPLVEFLEGLVHLLLKGVESVFKVLDAGMSVLAGIVHAVGNSIVTSITAITPYIISLAQTFLGGLDSIVGAVIDGITTVLTGVFQGIESGLNLISTVLDGISSIISSIADGVSSLVAVILGLAETIVSGVTEVFDEFFSLLVEILEGIKDFIGWIRDGGPLDLAKGAANAVGGVVSSVGEGLKGAASTVGGWFGRGSGLGEPTGSDRSGTTHIVNNYYTTQNYSDMSPFGMFVPVGV